jgi:thioredoxin 1
VALQEPEGEKMTELISSVNEKTFQQEVLGSGLPVLVDFWAPWCAPCRALQPTIDALASAFRGSVNFVKVNVDDNPHLAQQYGIRGIPTLVLFKAGKEERRLVGAAGRSAIERLIDGGGTERATA